MRKSFTLVFAACLAVLTQPSIHAQATPYLVGDFPNLAGVPSGSRQVWVNSNWSASPAYYAQNSATPPYYGSLYPLWLVRYQNLVTPAVRMDRFTRMRDAGVTGLNPMLYSSQAGNIFAQSNLDYFNIADGLTTLAGKQFLVAPMLQLDAAYLVQPTPPDVQPAVTKIKEYIDSASSHTSTARTTDGRYIIFNYRPEACGTSAEWAGVQTGLTSLGLSAYWISMAETHSFQTGWENSVMANWPPFEAQFLFVLGFGPYWDPIVSLMNDGGKKFSGGVLPGYDRENILRGGHLDAGSTELYREDWQRVIDSGLPWNLIITWDDWTERHNIGPSSDWNWTRADLTAWYAYKMGANALPSRLVDKANLYVTTPQRIRLNEIIQAEGLIINSQAYPRTVKIQMYDGNNALWGQTLSAVVPANQAGAVNTGSLTVTAATMPAGNFLRCKATAFDSAGGVLREVTSAPIVILDTSESSTFVMPKIHWSDQHSRRLYYSIPEYKALPSGSVTLSVSGNPNFSGATATVNGTSAVTAKFTEVLQNTYQVDELGFGVNTLTVPVPLENGMSRMGENISTDSWGFYVGRVITSDDYVGYSSPVFVTPPNNMVVNSGFESSPTSLVNWVTTGPDADADNVGTDYSIAGSRYGIHKKNGDYSVATSQIITTLPGSTTPLPNGAYTLKAWVQSSGNGNNDPITTMEAYNGTSYTFTSVPVTDDQANPLQPTYWRLITLGPIDVTSHQCKVIFRTTAHANRWTSFDNVWLYKNN
jgi:hypothetical protein